MHKKQLSENSAPAKRLRNKIYYNYLVTLKQQLVTNISVKFGRKGQLNKLTACPRREQGPELQRLLKVKEDSS